MKKNLPAFPQASMRFLAVVCLFSPLLLNGQINYFAPVGSTWYYDHTFFFGNNKNDYTKILTIGDTVLDGQTSSVLFVENADINIPDLSDTVFVRFNNGKVFRYFPSIDAWGLQYDFNASVGDILMCYGNYFAMVDSFKVRVDSVGTTSINGNELRTQYYTSLDGDWDYTQKVIEGIGGQNFLFTSWTLAENTNNGLRCYIDDTIGYYNTGMVDVCDTILYLGLNDHLELEKVSIFPTLTNSHITVKNPTPDKIELTLFDIRQCIISNCYILPYENKEIDFMNVLPGFYFAKIEFKNISKTVKIIKL